ncbi:MAG: hypothetical protein KJ950_08255 [Proteobacteria bacterium]|nr:hypothetical protein [Pseudomonadota bacterium]MBU1686483.1 hypothetical protein [Pseudomonadota bacterium]
MKRMCSLFLCFLVVLTCAIPPSYAGMVNKFEPIEETLVSDLPPEVKVPETKEEKGSSWWKWGLGLVAVGAIAAAAGGGGGGGGSSSSSGGSGNVSFNW